MSKAPKKSRRTRRRETGPRPGGYPKPLRWKIDYDYLDALSPDELEWLANFSDGHYGGDFRNQAALDRGAEPWDADQRRAAYTDKRAARQDAYGLGDAVGRVDYANGQDPRDVYPDEPAPVVEGDWSRTPEYLNTEEYKQALEEYRGHLHQGRRAREPAPSLALEWSRIGLSQTQDPRFVGTGVVVPLFPPTETNDDE